VALGHRREEAKREWDACHTRLPQPSPFRNTVRPSRLAGSILIQATSAPDRLPCP
jgi:hypothetical protein